MGRLEAILDALPIGVFIADENGTITHVNRQAADIWGGAPPLAPGVAGYSEYKGRWAATGEPLETSDWALARSITSGATVTGQEVVIERFDGGQGVILNAAALLRESDGRIVGAVAGLVDITEQKERERLTQAANRLASEVLADIDFDTRLHKIVAASAEALGADSAGALINNGATVTVKSPLGLPKEVAGLTTSWDEMPFSTASSKADMPLFFVITDDHPLIQRLPDTRSPWRRVLTIPLRARTTVIGSVVLMFVSDRADLSPAEQDFARSVMLTAPVALLNSQVISHEQETRRTSERLNEFNTAVTSTLDLKEVLGRLARLGAETLGVDASAVGLYEGERYRFHAVHRLPQALVDNTVQLEDNMGFLGESRLSQDVTVVECTQGKCPLCAGLAEGFDVQGVLHVPFVVRGDAVGGVSFFHLGEARHFDEHTIDTARKIGVIASLAVHNARLYEEMRRQERLNEALSQIGTAINSTWDFDEIMDFVVKLTAEALDAESAVIYILEDGEWAVRYTHGLPADLIGRKLLNEEIGYSKIAADMRKALIVNEPREDERVCPEIIESYGVKAVLDVPLVVGEEMIGDFSLHHHEEGKQFSSQDSEFANRVAAALPQALLNARRYTQEKAVASTLQSALLALPNRMHGIRFGELYRSATKTADVGGDFYDLFEISEHRVGIILGDVSGKGLPAATLTALVKNTIRAYAYEEHSPAKVMAKTNRVILRGTTLSSFVTVLYAVLDTRDGRLTYCSGGHPPAIIKRADGSLELLGEHSPAIGAWPGMVYEDAVNDLAPGDVLFAYTDGATEARVDSELFGEGRLLEALARSTGTVEDLPKRIYERVLAHTGGTLSDDLAMLAVEFVGDAPQQAARGAAPASKAAALSTGDRSPLRSGR